MSAQTILPTTMVGSYPRPPWFTQQLARRDVLEAFKVAQKGIKDLVGIMTPMLAAEAKPKMAWSAPAKDAGLAKLVAGAAEKAMAKAINAKDKHARAAGLGKVKEETLAKLAESHPDRTKEVHTELEDVEYRVMRMPRCSTRASASTAATSTPCARSRSAPGCCPGAMARRCSIRRLADGQHLDSTSLV